MTHTHQFTPGEIYPVTVDYSLSLARMIAAGQYRWVHTDITGDNFSTTGVGQAQVNTVLVNYRHIMFTPAILGDLSRRQLRPATISELLAFGATYPEKQQERLIFALGSIWSRSDNNRQIAYLRSSRHGRGVDLYWIDHHFPVDCSCFLAILQQQ